MARFNQQSGPSVKARQNRYEVRMDMAIKVAEELGGTVVREPANILVVVLPDGTRLGRRQAARILRNK